MLCSVLTRKRESEKARQTMTSNQGLTHVEKLPMLYGVEKNGKVKTWDANIYLKGTDMKSGHAFATIEHGQQDGKKQMAVRDYTEGKNIGKKNETTPLQQCIAETKKKWLDKKEKESYQETVPILRIPKRAVFLVLSFL